MRSGSHSYRIHRLSPGRRWPAPLCRRFRRRLRQPTGRENPNLSDADKVNQYLAWYLNGVTPNSDYSPNRDPDRTLNFSGPLKKLLPLESQNAIRSEVVTGPVGKQYHNYIVGCREQFDVLKTFTDGVQSVFKSAALASQAWRIPRVINNLYQAYTSHPDQLATLVATNAQVLLSNETNFLRIESVYQQAGLDQFAEDYAAVASAGKSLLESLNNLINDYALQHAISCTKSNDIQRLTDFRDNLPPDPQKYSSFGKYWHDYVNWLGSANLPFGLGSINVPWLPDFWAELFQNIPFSSLEDTVGEATISLPSASSQEIINPKLTIKKADSRLYFPHLKSVNALSTILANIFRPQPQPVSLSQEIAEHQGLDDFTLVQNKTTKNTEIRDNQPAPGPLYVSGQCDISDVRLLPAGDSLYGQQITARLAYTQKFRYTPTSGLPSGARCLPSNPNACQSKKCQQTGEDSESYKCTDPEPVRLPTTGRVSVFTKTPLIKNIYSTLISAPDSLLKRFVSQDSQSEIKPIESAVPAASGPLFFSGIGSLFDQLLGSSLANLNLQRLLRPLSTSISSPPLSPTGTCTDAAKPSTAACQTPAGPVRLYKSYCFASTEAQKLIENAAAWAGIPPEILGAILSIEGVKSSNELFRFSNADIIKYSQNGSYDPFYCSPNQCGAMGPAQILTDLGVQPSCSQAAGNNEWAKFGDAVVRACVAPSGYAPNPANLRDNVYAAALLIKDKSNTVSANSRNWSKALVYETARRYYGSCAPLPHSRLADLKEANFCLSPNLPEYSVPPLGYCDYVWYYYSRREYGSVNLTPAPSPSDTALPNPRHPTPQ
ncbi:MAG: hypothetical protein UX92_C0014G0043 [Candidatus Amesbacteria bacterium GW2011_GWA1_47_20]|uniref:Transglycosylase SLT domain-containing protein n=1 Tax=Candidatus Amesbacteria bacterium GW2011_GWA1_47_20 TaxID=1618354 RepID=A0A0G1SI90_9BACT|nr:MAG: hypothetical protein UX92_C0014G0043 [Candidatus Amesbacteria bacterium GW2011_GWA1_47_20]